ncbi:MAG: class I SAM-dependent methyltransferase [Stackebrandtia sp.]
MLLPVTAGFAVAATLLFVLAGDTGLLAAVAGSQVLLLGAIAAVARRQEAAEKDADRRLRGQVEAVRLSVNKRGFENRRRLDELREELDGVRAEASRRFAQTDYLIGLYYDLRPKSALPATGGWAASADLLRCLYDTVRDEGRSRIVECGSGVSTLVMAYALRELGGGKITSLDHDADFAAQTRRMLEQHELQQWAEVRHAPLTKLELDDEIWLWYELAEVPDGPFDMLVIDGPPRATRDQARYPALPLLYDRLGDDAVVVLDDHIRPDERAAAARWIETYPTLKQQVFKQHDKETLILRKA